MPGHRLWQSACRRLAATAPWFLLGWLAIAAFARGPGTLEPIHASALPPEARQTLERIRAGGPFPYAKDGSTFANREGRLPDRPRGYYREYTVPTPGRQDRGARRIVTGGTTEFYWTVDHYRSFRRITGVP